MKRKGKNGQKKKKKAGQKPVGAQMQGCPVFLQTHTGKTPGIKKDTCSGLADVSVQGSAGRTANLGLLFDFDGSVNFKKAGNKGQAKGKCGPEME